MSKNLNIWEISKDLWKKKYKCEEKKKLKPEFILCDKSIVHALVMPRMWTVASE